MSEPKRASKREAKEAAQKMLMHGIGNVLGYWHEDMNNSRTAANLGLTQEEFGEVLLAQADRVARLLGFEEAWCN
jgi:hypothetical protein